MAEAEENVGGANMITLRVPLRLWQKINCYVLLCLPNEVTGTGILKKTSNHELVVEEIFLPNQTVSPGESDFTEVGMHEIISDLIMAGTPEKVERLKFRWHSHAYGNCFFSVKDLHDIAEYSGDFVVNLVMNGAGEYLVRLDIFEPLRLENLPIRLVVDYPIGRKMREACKAEVDNKVALKGGEVGE